MEQFRPTLDFNIAAQTAQYTLFFNPDLMAAPIYVCEHVMHQRKAQGYLRNTVKTADLKAFQFPEDNVKVAIINSLGEREEATASEARH